MSLIPRLEALHALLNYTSKNIHRKDHNCEQKKLKWFIVQLTLSFKQEPLLYLLFCWFYIHLLSADGMTELCSCRGSEHSFYFCHLQRKKRFPTFLKPYLWCTRHLYNNNWKKENSKFAHEKMFTFIFVQVATWKFLLPSRQMCAPFKWKFSIWNKNMIKCLKCWKWKT